ncbi:MAG: hypothetical protein CBC48_00125 [bacterium TMED88]|nr:MAG: hypothetical protein CBC48_00125 [bacterium TMED88]
MKRSNNTILNERLTKMACIPKNIITFEKGWESIQKVLDVMSQIALGNFKTHLSFSYQEYMQIYNTVHNMCSQRSPYNAASKIYEAQCRYTVAYLIENILPMLQKQSGVVQLRKLMESWRSYKVFVKWLRKFFLYIDRYHVVQENKHSIKQSAIRAFREHVFDNVYENTTESICNMLNEYRLGKSFDEDFLKQIVAFYAEMSEVYMNGRIDTMFRTLIRPIQSKSKEFYSHQSKKYVHNIQTYLVWVEKMIQCDTNCYKYIDPYYVCKHGPKYIASSYVSMLCPYTRPILDTVQNFFATSAWSSISRIYNLFRALEKLYTSKNFTIINPGSDFFTEAPTIMQKEIEKSGTFLIEAREKQVKEKGKDSLKHYHFIQQVLLLHEKVLGKVKEHCNDSRFEKGIKFAFTEFFNKDVCEFSNAQLLASYCDSLLKVDEQTFENDATAATCIFQYLNDKDVFANTYENMLSKRLYNRKIKNIDNEKLLISKLKIQCGSLYTQKMEGMIVDWFNYKKCGVVAQGPFHQHLTYEAHVLTNGNWPSDVKIVARIPALFAMVQDEVSRGYHKERSKATKLRWAYGLGTCEVSMNKVTLITTTLQALVLQLFDEDRPYPFVEILDSVMSTRATDMGLILKKIMHSLSCLKYKVLLKEPMSRSIKETDVFRVNYKFKSKKNRLQLPIPSLQDTRKKKEVIKDRRHTIDAAIVRIMKSRQELGHNALIAEVVKQLQFFKPGMKQIKQCIEKLIDRDFLERKDGARNVYTYLA